MFFNVINSTKTSIFYRNYFLKCDFYILKCKNCTLEEQAIINILKVNPTANQEEIARQINKSVRTVKTYMAEMKEERLIERKKGKKNGEWIVT